MPHVTTDLPDYTDTNAFPAFASKAELLQALSDPANNADVNLYDRVLARLANTDTSTWADPTATLADNVVGRRAG